MNSNEFFSILKSLEKYANLNKDNEGEIVFKNDEYDDPGRRFIVHPDKLQTSFLQDEWKDYEYFFHDKGRKSKKPFAKVHAFLQGAIQDKLYQTSPDQSFLDYQRNVLKMFFGMFVFIDPTKNKDSNAQMPYYLLGPMVGKPLQPSFNFKFYNNIENVRGNYEFTEPPAEWLRFFLALNEFNRDTLAFDKQDFVRLFNYNNYKFKRNKIIERSNNIFYISSGEMDNCILQWFSLYLKKSNNLKYYTDILNTNLSIDLKELYPGIEDFYSDERYINKNYFVPNYRLKKDGEEINYKTPIKKFQVWLQLWGFLDSGIQAPEKVTDSAIQPTERFLAVFEWLYYYLLIDENKVLTEENKDNDKTGYYDFRNYLTLVNTNPDDPGHIYLSNIDKQKRDKYIKLVESVIPVKTTYKWQSVSSNEANFKQLIQLYFEIIFSWEESKEHIDKFSENKVSWEVFGERCRFRPFVHFIFRNFSSSIDNKFIEKTCRGFIAFPILSSYKTDLDEKEHDTNNENEEIRYVGYFLGLFKDSDAKGRCLFNWHKNTEFELSQTVNNTFEDNFFELKQVMNELGRIETEQIYFRGIVRMHQEEARRQSIHSAIAACMSRNLSHTTGSHKSPWFKNFLGDYFQEMSQYYRQPNSSIPVGIESAIKSIKGGLKKFTVDKANEEVEIKNLNTHLLNYFDFVNDNMEFIADVTTSYSPNKITFNYSIQNIYEEYSSLKLMHHGLFDDKKMVTSIKLYSIDNETNEYLNATVALPNGQLGKTAIFIIIENFLRNFYKHTAQETNYPKFYINVASSDKLPDDFWCIDFFDNVSSEENNTKRTTALLEKINNDFINKSILQSNGTLRSEGWGFIEMKACAAYLVNYPIEHIDKIKSADGLIKLSADQIFHPLIEANYYNDNGIIVTDFDRSSENKNLGYRFYLKKAKKVGIEEDAIVNIIGQREKIDTVSKEGIQVLQSASIDNRTQHDILILNGVNSKVDPNQRHFISNKFDFSLFKDASEIELHAWIKYIECKFENENLEYQIVKNFDELNAIFSTIPTKSIILIDDHGRLAKEKQFNFDFLQNLLWYLPEENRTKKDIDFYFQEKYSLLIRLRLIEVINTRISIYDERIQQETNSSYNNIPQLTLSKLHLLGNIFIPDLETDNLADNNVIPGLEEALKTRFETDDYIVIHFTLFERLAEYNGYSTSLKGNKNLKEYYEKLVREWRLESRGRIIVFCSGRGRPSNLFSTCYYIHLSTLQYFTVRTISKYSLVNALKSLRKI